MKIVYNACFGGFGLSAAALEAYNDLRIRRGEPIAMHKGYAIERDDPDLVTVVEQLGEAANAKHADLTIRDIPDGSVWSIDEYDGNEAVVIDERATLLEQADIDNMDLDACRQLLHKLKVIS